MADKKEMNRAILIQAAGFIIIFIIPGFIKGLLPAIIGAIIGIPLVGLGIRKYRKAKKNK